LDEWARRIRSRMTHWGFGSNPDTEAGSGTMPHLAASVLVKVEDNVMAIDFLRLAACGSGGCA
jgi:hypothetical protein